MKKIFLSLLVLPLILACSTGVLGDYRSGLLSGKSSDGKGSGNTQAGIVTAGEWSDLDHWTWWSLLMTGNEFSDKSGYWGFYLDKRVAVKVSDSDGIPVPSALVELKNAEGIVWQARTNNKGEANCWLGLYGKNQSSKGLSISINGIVQPGEPQIMEYITESKTPEEATSEKFYNKYTVGTSSVAYRADIAFIVDATGSMGDEISFLKEDLDYIIKKAASIKGAQLRTAALFYRDEGDEYVTRHSDFSANFETTRKFISEQNAAGGGDYPEAVHTALEESLQKLSWDEKARTRLAFMILDAPAHNLDEVKESIRKSIRTFAKNGIIIIPVAASGVDKNTEFMLRFFAAVTGGTYVFITNDSGVGNEHIKASVGKYTVEQLNDLISRLIASYTE